MMLVKGEQIVDLDLNPTETETQGSVGYITPIIGVKDVNQMDYDRKTNTLFWVELDAPDSDNVRNGNSVK